MKICRFTRKKYTNTQNRIIYVNVLCETFRTMRYM